MGSSLRRLRTTQNAAVAAFESCFATRVPGHLHDAPAWLRARVHTLAVMGGQGARGPVPWAHTQPRFRPPCNSVGDESRVQTKRGSELPRASPISHRQDLKAGQRAPQASSWRESVGGALLGPVCCCWLCLLRVANGRQWRSAAWERRREGSCTLRVKHATSPNEPLAPRTLVWDTMYDAVRDYSDDAAAADDAVVAVTAAGSGFGSAGRRPCWRNAPTVSWRDRSMGVNRTPRPSTARSWEKSACG